MPSAGGGVKPSARPATTQRASAPAGLRAQAAKREQVGPSAASKPRSRLRVYTKTEEDEIGIQTLVGDYTEMGVNHGRPFYEKVSKLPGHEEVEVFVYYWDTRDGPEFSGWWFGDKVGGSQVWSRAMASGKEPPEEGWRVPWDGEAIPGLLLVEVQSAAELAQPVSSTAQAAQSPKAAPPKASPSAPRPGASPAPQSRQPPVPARRIEVKVDPADLALREERVRIATERVEAAEGETGQVVNNAKEMSGPEEADESNFAEAESALKSHQEALMEEQKLLAKDLSEARSSGFDQSSIAELTRLQPRLRTLQQTLASELQRVQTTLVKVRQRAAMERKKAEAEEQAIEAEQRDARSFQTALPEAMELVTTAEDAVETVAILAAAVAVEDEISEVERQAIQDIEKAAIKASQELNEARRIVGNRLVDSKRFAPEAKKVALQEYQGLQDRLSEATTRLGPLKGFRKEFELKAAARKAMLEITQKLSSAELEVEKAHIMTSSVDQQMEKDDIASTTELLGPAQAGLAESLQLIDRRMRSLSGGGDGPEGVTTQRKELEGLQERAKDAQKKLEGIRAALKRQEECLDADRLLAQAHEKIEQAEEAFVATTEAEMPFLKGLEVLPRDEGMAAVAQCEAATAKCESALQTARSFLKQVSSDAKTRFSKEAAKRFAEELSGLRSRGEETEKKLIAFKRETAQRKTKAMLQEVTELVAEAANQAQTLAEVVKLLNTDNLEEVTAESLKAAIEQSAAAEKDASAAFNTAKTQLAAKQKEAKDSSLMSELTKLQQKLSTVNQDLQKCRRIAKNGELMIKGKEVLTKEEEKVAKVESVIDEMDALAAPIGGEEEIKEEAMKKIDAAVKSASLALAETSRTCDMAMAGAQTFLRGPLGKLLARLKKGKEKIERVKAATRAQMEKAQAEANIKESEKHVEAAEEMLNKLGEAELPFLKGIEVLPLKESWAAIKDCEAAAKKVQEALDQSKSFVAAKNLEVQKFAEAASKPAVERMSALAERNNAVAQKLTQFRQDTEQRKRVSHLQQAGDLLKEAELEVEKSREVAAPLASEDLSTITAELATEICEKLASIEKAAQKKMQETISFIAERRKDMKGHAAQEEELQKIEDRLKKVKSQLSESKKAASQQEQRFVARKLLAEAGDLVTEVEEEVKKVSAVAAPLIDRNGMTFLVQAGVQKLAAGLQELITKGEVESRDALFSKVCGEAGSLTQAAFKAFLSGLEDAHEDLSFSEAQQEEMFKRLDVDSSGDLSKAEFEGIFTERFVCIQKITMTDGLDISSAKSVIKLDVDTLLEATGPSRTDEASQITRLPCRLVEDTTKSGWVTMKGNAGKVFLKQFTPHNSGWTAFQRQLSTSTRVSSKTSSFLGFKCKELEGCLTGPLAEAKGNMKGFLARVAASSKQLEELNKKVAQSVKEYGRLEEEEKRARQEAQERKAAEVIIKDVEGQLQPLESEFERLSEALKPLTTTNGSELEALAAPVSLIRDGERQSSELNDKLAAARTKLETHQVAKKPSRGHLADARLAVTKAIAKVDTLKLQSASLLEAARGAASKAALAALGRAQRVLRDAVKAKETTLEAWFQELAGEASSESISSEAFRKQLSELPELNLSSEQVALLFSKYLDKGEGIGNISRGSFMRAMQQFYICVRSIAITHEFVIGKGKPQRMLAEDEVVEVLEGPQGDEKLGVMRVRARMLSDGLVGWISVSGNQGTVFLKEKTKPYLCCTAELPLEKDFKSVGDAPLRVLKAEEVIEVLEGPRKDCMEPVMRVKCKATSDGAVGWFTMSSSSSSSSSGPAAEQKENKFFNCTAAIAMTDNQNIKQCKVMRKLEVGEVVRVLEGPVTDTDSGVTRIRAKSTKGGVEGWVTVKGNAGTTYVEEATKLYTVVREVSLQKEFASEASEVVRTLVPDEAVEILEGPKKETFEAVTRIKGRALADDVVGWVSKKERKLKAWVPEYRCGKETVIQNTLCTRGAGMVRRLDEGELIETLEGPKEDTEVGLLRIRGRAEKDGAVGWISVRGNQGTQFLVQRQGK
eukprot:TRINITY_DN22604_c0_g1_i1.p1 TRINITY_DN22604_c0_g1~~TRINITY_DN22604_c0_g1_i1.p1  ORF type:complete len:2058 (+),score=625.53 TRINITY_DN22604_c0_g1_i1:78-6176(+)